MKGNKRTRNRERRNSMFWYSKLLLFSRGFVAPYFDSCAFLFLTGCKTSHLARFFFFPPYWDNNIWIPDFLIFLNTNFAYVYILSTPNLNIFFFVFLWTLDIAREFIKLKKKGKISELMKEEIISFILRMIIKLKQKNKTI